MEIKSFDSFEEMAAYQQQQAELAHRAAVDATDAQKRIGYGDHFFVQTPIPGEGHVLTFGQVVPARDTVLSELLHVSSYRPRQLSEAEEAFVERVCMRFASDEHGRVGHEATWNGEFRSDGALVDYWLEVMESEFCLRVDMDTVEEFRSFYLSHCESWRTGYRFTRCFSKLIAWQMPEGELGSHHISRMVPLSHTEYAEAAAWPTPWTIESALADGSLSEAYLDMGGRQMGELFAREVGL